VESVKKPPNKVLNFLVYSPKIWLLVKVVVLEKSKNKKIECYEIFGQTAPWNSHKAHLLR